MPLKAQNFVPNPGFDVLAGCPNPANWSGYQNTPDKFNSCNGTMPNNFAGNQAARSGNGYVAIVDRHATALYHEFVGTALTGPLTAGETYCVEFYVSLTELSQWGADNMGVQFNTAASASMNGVSEVYTTTVILDKTNWVQISGTFVAAQPYTNVAVGNFFPDAATTIQAAVGGTYAGAYYYIEDVSVTACGVLDGSWTHTAAQRGNEGSIVLEWQYEGREISEFIIERGYNDSDFEQITHLNGNEEFNTFRDRPGYGSDLVLYRIRAIDKNGDMHTSRIIESYMDEEAVEAFAVSPVPAKAGEQITVDFSHSYDSPVEVRLTDLRGSLLHQDFLAPGNVSMSLMTNDLPAGTYLLQVTFEGRRETRRVLLY